MSAHTSTPVSGTSARTEPMPPEALSASPAGRDLPKDLRGAELMGRDLRGIDLSGADLSGANLSSADLAGAKLSGAKLVGSNLDGANLRGATLFSARLEGATFTRAVLSDADLRSAKLRGARLREADLRGADLSCGELPGADLTNARVGSAHFYDCDLTQTKLSGIREYADADWIGAKIAETDFCGVYMARRMIADQNFLHEFRNRSRANAIAYWIWSATSDCGRSVLRWSAWIGAIVLAFAGIYQFVDIDYGDYATWLSPVYYSVVTLTTLGYGDVLPKTVTAQLVAMAEVFLGYVMLGGLLSIFANKMARRAD